MSSLAFLSYRRDDTSQVAQALYLQLKEVFGSGQLFMDVNSIRAGEAWPERIRRRIEEATLLLLLIGPSWLFACDKYGRRRIDDRTDWVRNEILHALRKEIPIIPIAVDDRANLPVREALPTELQRLPLVQAEVLRLDPAEWSADVSRLGRVLRGYGLVPRDAHESKPVPSLIKQRAPALSDEELAKALGRLPEWEPWRDTLAHEYPVMRQELRRTFTFRSFKEAIAFMKFVAPRFEKRQHHPLWSNTWTTVTIRLTTWDADYKITRYDVETARMVDAAYKEFRAR